MKPNSFNCERVRQIYAGLQKDIDAGGGLAIEDLKWQGTVQETLTFNSANPQFKSSKFFDENLRIPLGDNEYKSIAYRIESYGYYVTNLGASYTVSCRAPSVEADPTNAEKITRFDYSKGDKQAIAIIEEDELKQTNLCIPILKEFWGVKFTYDEEGKSKNWALTLAPAVKSQANNRVPNAMPGLRIQAKAAFSKKEVPGWHSIYQPMGVESVYVTMVGTFTGDGGFKFQDSGAYRDFATYNAGSFEGRQNPVGVIDPTTNPNYNVGNRFISGVSDFNDNASVAALQKQIGVENATLANFVNREGLFDRVGCDGECPPPYRGLFGEEDGPIKYPDFDIAIKGAPGTYTRQELHAYLDAYHEFDDFLRFSVVNGRELDVEVNMRKSLDGLRPKDRDWMPNEPTLRNGTTGNIKFKGVVRTIDSYYARSNRVWYTIVMEVTELGLKELAGADGDNNYYVYEEGSEENSLNPEFLAFAQDYKADKDQCASILQVLGNSIDVELRKIPSLLTSEVIKVDFSHLGEEKPYILINFKLDKLATLLKSSQFITMFPYTFLVTGFLDGIPINEKSEAIQRAIDKQLAENPELQQGISYEKQGNSVKVFCTK